MNYSIVEPVKLEPFAVVAPFAEQACDLVKHDCHFTLLSGCPQDWKLLEARPELTAPYSHRQKMTLERTAASCYNAATAQGPHNSSPHSFKMQL